MIFIEVQITKSMLDFLCKKLKLYGLYNIYIYIYIYLGAWGSIMSIKTCYTPTKSMLDFLIIMY